MTATLQEYRERRLFAEGARRAAMARKLFWQDKARQACPSAASRVILCPKNKE